MIAMAWFKDNTLEKEIKQRQAELVGSMMRVDRSYMEVEKVAGDVIRAMNEKAGGGKNESN